MLCLRMRHENLISCYHLVSQGTTSTGAAAAAPAAPRVQSDVWDLMEPEDILTKLGKRDGEKASFLQAASSEKWKGVLNPLPSSPMQCPHNLHVIAERLAAFADLRELASSPRLAPGDYGEISRTIKRVLMKDANVAVVTEAASASATLATGLRREYRSDARLLTAPLLDKFKEKNTGVIRAVHTALSAFSTHCYSLSGTRRGCYCHACICC